MSKTITSLTIFCLIYEKSNRNKSNKKTKRLYEIDLFIGFLQCAAVCAGSYGTYAAVCDLPVLSKRYLHQRVTFYHPLIIVGLDDVSVNARWWKTNRCNVQELSPVVAPCRISPYVRADCVLTVAHIGRGLGPRL